MRRNQESKSKRQTLTTTLTTTGAELLKLQREFNNSQKTPPCAPQKAVHPSKTPTTRVRFIKPPKHKQRTSSYSLPERESSNSDVESVVSGNLSEGSVIIVRTGPISIARTPPICRSPPPMSQTPPSPSPAPTGKGKQAEGPAKCVLRSRKP